MQKSSSMLFVRHGNIETDMYTGRQTRAMGERPTGSQRDSERVGEPVHLLRRAE
jgi:hypothetical protein